ncbi:MAG: 2-C-methyl-D-erythritol 2,4-cyclodiphosphate synthase [Bacteroidales bacterium]|nr:2-C-methyl-D-erythritol 2,4-cyclodiphosphate synthase [Bacteroidales bacterium]
MESLRVGLGYDVHQLETGRRFTLGGIHIPFDKGPVAHSDGDVLIHAICDALLGAANLGDIGVHFPDTSDEFKGVDSKVLLRIVVEKLEEINYSVVNLDTMVSLQSPKLKEYIPSMKDVLSRIMKISTNDVSIKATTTEHLGYIGRGEGIAAQAVVLIGKE